mmetsp:Transcript_13784/g.29864  ORF Transcript_13784/g.29864 Transcript_13784/m.29864 type:complete len:86 (-) Transcript_13784:165-422(-)
MMSQKTVSQLEECLKARGLKFTSLDSKRELIDRVWDNRKIKNTGYNIKQLDCSHLFHFRCLKEWMTKRDSCPNCRKTVGSTAEQK